MLPPLPYSADLSFDFITYISLIFWLEKLRLIKMPRRDLLVRTFFLVSDNFFSSTKIVRLFQPHQKSSTFLSDDAEAHKIFTLNLFFMFLNFSAPFVRERKIHKKSEFACCFCCWWKFVVEERREERTNSNEWMAWAIWVREGEVYVEGKKKKQVFLWRVEEKRKTSIERSQKSLNFIAVVYERGEENFIWAVVMRKNSEKEVSVENFKFLYSGRQFLGFRRNPKKFEEEFPLKFIKHHFSHDFPLTNLSSQTSFPKTHIKILLTPYPSPSSSINPSYSSNAFFPHFFYFFHKPFTAWLSLTTDAYPFSIHTN